MQRRGAGYQLVRRERTLAGVGGRAGDHFESGRFEYLARTRHMYRVCDQRDA